jgi:alginate O-acetyltransferase complex protein AlgI
LRFSEIPFFLFFAAYLGLHFAVPPRWRIHLIIAGSTVFYAWWRVDYVWLPFALTLTAWAGAILVENEKAPARRKRRLATVIALLFLPLVVVKYSYFVLSNVVKLVPVAGVALGDVSQFRFALPLGISFLTFTLTAYIVDTYRGRFPVEPRIANLLAYALFFPHLIAGPILRPNELLPQLKQWRRAIDARFTLGTALFAIGLVKKVVFADGMAGAVDEVFAPEVLPSAWDYLLAIHGFSLQIYCDFSGYTDMAIGIAYILRIRLPTNFRRPYTARSIIDFWRRWHITLSFWLRDYLYIPLGGNRYGQRRRFFNLMTTMVLGGLWHGAGWTFVIWGGLHGAALATAHIVHGLFRRRDIHIPRALGLIATFYFVTVSWVYFRAPDIATAHRVLMGPFTASWRGADLFASARLYELVLLLVFFVTHHYDRHARVRIAVRRSSQVVIWVLIVLGFVIAITVSQGSSSKFIYFDF